MENGSIVYGESFKASSTVIHCFVFISMLYRNKIIILIGKYPYSNKILKLATRLFDAACRICQSASEAGTMNTLRGGNILQKIKGKIDALSRKQLERKLESGQFSAK